MTEESVSNEPKSIADLDSKMRLKGTVEKISLHGALVDIGLGCEGVLHISQIVSSDNGVDLVSDELQPGDKIDVWVSEVHPEKNHVSLTMIEPPDVTWRELEEGQVYTGTVTRIESYGAFVDVGAERPGLLHVREMSAGYVDHPSEMVDLHEEIQVRVLKVDEQRRRIDLTMKGLEPEAPQPEPQEPVEQEEEQEEEAPQTSMELALERAYADEERRKRIAQSRSERRESDFSEREEILKRTLEQHSESESEESEESE